MTVVAVEAMPVYYITSRDSDKLTVPVLDVYRGWDGELYAETNVMEAAGPQVVTCRRNAIPRISLRPELVFSAGNASPMWDT